MYGDLHVCMCWVGPDGSCEDTKYTHVYIHNTRSLTVKRMQAPAPWAASQERWNSHVKYTHTYIHNTQSLTLKRMQGPWAASQAARAALLEEREVLWLLQAVKALMRALSAPSGEVLLAQATALFRCVWKYLCVCVYIYIYI